MRGRRFALGVAVALGVTVAVAGPAGAHATFGVSTVPVSSQQTLTMDVPHEREDTVYNTKVAVLIASGWDALSCQAKATWTCAVGADPSGKDVVRFTKTSSQRSEDESFTFVVRTASAVGSFSFPTVQTYNTGEEVAWIGAAGSEEPAPVLKTCAPGSCPTGPPPQTTPSHTQPSATTAPGGGSTSPTAGGGTGGPANPGDPNVTSTTGPAGDPATSLDPTATTSVAGEDLGNGATATTVGTGGSESAAATDSSGSDGGGAAVWIALGLLVVVAAGGGVVIWRRTTATAGDRSPS